MTRPGWAVLNNADGLLAPVRLHEHAWLMASDLHPRELAFFADFVSGLSKSRLLRHRDAAQGYLMLKVVRSKYFAL